MHDKGENGWMPILPTLRSAAGEALCLKAFLENAVRLSRLLEWIVMRTHAGY